MQIQLSNKYNDIFLSRIEELEFCLAHEYYIAALNLALTLPDICGKAEFPNENPTRRYIEWFNKYMVDYAKSDSKYSEDMPYISGEVVYNLRCSVLHSGNPNIEPSKIHNELCKIDEFELEVGKTLIGDTSMVAYGKNKSIVKRGYTLNIYLLCIRLCCVAKEYYLNNQSKFDFFDYSIVYNG